MNGFVDYLLTAVFFGMTFLFGCTGEILTEKSGNLNLGIPGIMCIGGASGCVAIYAMQNSGIPAFLIVTIAILASFLGGFAMGAIYCFLTVSLKSNQNVTGLAMTIFGAGATKFIMSGMVENGGMGFLYARNYFRYPFANSTNSMKFCGVMVYLAIIIALVSSFVLSKTRVGLHLRAVGESPATANAVGINVTRYKYLATCIGSGVAALGGIFYIMDYSGSGDAYKNIEALGWLSVALVIFTLWRPHLSILGSIVFGALYLAGSYIPTLLKLKLDMSMTPLMQLLPYVVTIVVLIVTSIRNKRENQPPAALGLHFFKEER